MDLFLTACYIRSDCESLVPTFISIHFSFFRAVQLSVECAPTVLTAMLRNPKVSRCCSRSYSEWKRASRFTGSHVFWCWGAAGPRGVLQQRLLHHCGKVRIDKKRCFASINFLK